MAIPSDALYSGTCGTCNWYVSANRKLVIEPTSGNSGEIKKENSMFPWSTIDDDNTTTTISESFTSVEVKSGVTVYEGRGSSIFAGCPNVVTIDAPATFWNSFKNIRGAFKNDVNLTAIYFHGATLSSVTGSTNDGGGMLYMFKGCEKLKNIDTSTFIGGGTHAGYSEMFRGCKSIEYLDLRNLNTTGVDTMSGMFRDCVNLKKIDLFNLSGSSIKYIYSMFNGCESLASLDLTSFNTSAKPSMHSLFFGCNLLTEVTFGQNWYCKDGDDLYMAPCGHTTSNIICTTDNDFNSLTTAQRAGTWRRLVSASFKSYLKRTKNGQEDEDGTDVTITSQYATSATTTTRTLKFYKKLATTSTYPSSPDATVTVSGNSGTNTYTISNIGDDAYDFRIEFYDGTNTFVSFPSLASNIHLVDIDKNANVTVYGNLAVPNGDVIVGGNLTSKNIGQITSLQLDKAITSADTWTEGAYVTIPEGTWIMLGVWWFADDPSNTSTARSIELRIVNSSNTVQPGASNAWRMNNSQYVHLQVMTIGVFSSETYKLQAKCSRTTTTEQMTRLIAIRIK